MAKKVTNFSLDWLKNKGMVEVEKGVFQKPLDNKPITSPVTVEKINVNGQSNKRALISLDEFTFLGKNATPLAVFDIEPMGAPRMTRSDKWKLDPNHKNPKSRQRKVVGRYFAFRANIIAQAQKQGFTMPSNGFHVIFILPMPHSWADKKKNQMYCAPHQQKPDCDNMIKAVKDSLCKDDAHIWDYRITKYWGKAGKILIYSL